MDGIYDCGRDCSSCRHRTIISLEPCRFCRIDSEHIFVLGVAAVIQCLQGHRLPINESPAGLWWGVYTIYGGLTGTVFATFGETSRAPQGRCY